MIPQLSFGVFHVVQNELIGLKSFNHSIDRLKAFHDKPRPLFGSQENTEVNENIHSQVISFASKKTKKKKISSAMSILSGIFLYSRIIVGENFIIQNFINFLHIFSVKTFPNSNNL